MDTEKDRIMALPKVQMNFGSTRMEAYVDMAARRMYLANSDGTLTGKAATIKDEQQARIQALLALAQKNATPPITDSMPPEIGKTIVSENLAVESQATGEKKNPREAEKRSAGLLAKTIIPFIAISVFSMLLAGTALFVSLRHESPVEAMETNTESETAESLPVSQSVRIIQAGTELLPGDTITKESLIPAEISIEQYNALLISEHYPVLWEYADAVSGLVVLQRIRQGEYFLSNGVSATFHPECSVWMRECEETMLLRIPAETVGTDVYPGDTLTISLTDDSGEEDVTHMVMVCALLNEGGSDIYEIIYPYLNLDSYELKDILYQRTGLLPSREQITAKEILAIPMEEQLKESYGNPDSAKVSAAKLYERGDGTDEEHFRYAYEILKELIAESGPYNGENADA